MAKEPTDKAIRAAMMRWAKAEASLDKALSGHGDYGPVADRRFEVRDGLLRLAQRLLAAQEPKR